MGKAPLSLESQSQCCLGWGHCAFVVIRQHDGELTSLVVIPVGVWHPHEEPALLLETLSYSLYLTEPVHNSLSHPSLCSSSISLVGRQTPLTSPTFDELLLSFNFSIRVFMELGTPEFNDIC